MRRLFSPITVLPSALVPRLIVTNSRTVVLFPISTVVISPVNLRSCGTAEITAPGNILQSFPIRAPGKIVTLAGHITVEDFAIIGGLSAVHQFVQVGSHVMISGGSLVRKDVPPFVKAAHEPLSYVGINAVGLRRRGFSPEKIAEIQDIYRLFFVKGYSNTHALEVIEKEIQPSEEKNQILSFIRKSTRGLMKGYTQDEE